MIGVHSKDKLHTRNKLSSSRVSPPENWNISLGTSAIPVENHSLDSASLLMLLLLKLHLCVHLLPVMLESIMLVRVSFIGRNLPAISYSGSHKLELPGELSKHSNPGSGPDKVNQNLWDQGM